MGLSQVRRRAMSMNQAFTVVVNDRFVRLYLVGSLH